MHAVNTGMAGGATPRRDLLSRPVGDQTSFSNRLVSSFREGDRRIAFVVGSGLSAGSVPSVPAMVERMRDAVGPDLRRDFDRSVKMGQDDSGSEYRKAAEFVYLNSGRIVLNRVIRDAVLEACPRAVLRSGRSDLEKVEATGGWTVPGGVAALGKIVTALPAERRGPILTTNFDPLIEVAIRQAGGSPRPHALDRDGSFRRIETGAIDVVHVHGFWRETDTLHLDFQLSTERPRLEDEIRRSLVGCDVFVLGYGGWDDVFTRTLRNRVKASHFDDMDVMWSTYQEIDEEWLASEGSADLTEGANVVLYDGVDANVVLPEALRRLRADRSSGDHNVKTVRRGSRKVPRSEADDLKAVPHSASVKTFRVDSKGLAVTNPTALRVNRAVAAVSVNRTEGRLGAGEDWEPIARIMDARQTTSLPLSSGKLSKEETA